MHLHSQVHGVQSSGNIIRHSWPAPATTVEVGSDEQLCAGLVIDICRAMVWQSWQHIGSSLRQDCTPELSCMSSRMVEVVCGDELFAVMLLQADI